MSRSRFALTGLLLLPMALGCRGGMFTDASNPQTFVDPPTTAPTLAPVESVESAATTEETSEQSLLAIVDELTEIGALDETSKRELMADLQEAKPENWPMIVKQYRSVLAYRKQRDDREREQARGYEALEAGVETLADQSLDSRLRANHPLQSPRRPRTRPGEQLASSREVAPTNPTPVVLRPTNEQEPLAAPTRPQPQAVVLSKPPKSKLLQASYEQPELPAGDWKQQLNIAVQDMEASLPSDPVSVDEVNEHMRLRLLQLLAGNQEQALQPVPGATAPQQDYWNRQLFAVSTFLDSQSQPDNKRRATGSLTYLDQARAKLAELATLQVQNLAFVESVDGYGNYTLREQSKFQPGDPVTLYAEIENFTSESTKDGHRTRLGTSFEILDKNGKRIDSAQFPEVEDVCRTPRRDFHMQYTVTLPTRIYADEYEIRLIVTDEQSQKIGRASLHFEIAE